MINIKDSFWEACCIDLNADFKILDIGENAIIVGGIAKMFYQDGFPIGMCISRVKEKGYTVSILHIADELQKQGWNNKTILSKLREEWIDSGEDFPYEHVEKFLSCEYENQRKMIFEYLYGMNWEKARLQVKTDYNG